MASECTEGLWETAAQLQPSAYSAEDITDSDMQVTLLDGTFTVPLSTDSKSTPHNA